MQRSEKLVVRFLIFVQLVLFFQPSFGQRQKDEFIIGIFWPPVWKHTNEAQYRALRDANVDLIQNVESTDLNTKERNFAILDLAEKFGMKVYVSDRRIHGTTDDVRAMVADYRDHPATAGYYIADEPNQDKLPWATSMYKLIAGLDPDKIPHVNLFPDFAIKNYEKEYVEKWINGVGNDKLKYLSFDIYPYKARGKFEKSYYNNLDIIRRAGLKYNIKTSSYLQSFGIPNVFRRPTVNEMRLNVYSNLAYGIKKPVWFCYATPTGQGDKFYNSVIDSLGNKTDLYEPFTQLNAEMKAFGKKLIYLDAREVYHSGDSLWMGTTRVPKNYIWQPADPKSQLIITRFVSRDGSSDKEYIMVVNKSFREAKQFSFRVRDYVHIIREVSKTNGKLRRAPSFNRNLHTLTDTFLPGEGKLYELTIKGDVRMSSP